MKRIIDQKVYDTENAEIVCSEEFGSCRDYNHHFSTLHRTKKCAFFLHEGGGAGTEFGRKIGSNTTTGSENIRPLSDQEAADYLAEHSPENALEIFPHLYEDA